MKAGADLQEGADPTAHDDLALRWVGDAGEDLEDGALAGAVPADDAEDLAALDLEVDVLEGPEGVLRLCGLPEGPQGVAHRIGDALREPFVGLIRPDLVFLGEVLHLDDRLVFLCCHVTPGPRSISQSGGGTGCR